MNIRSKSVALIVFLTAWALTLLCLIYDYDGLAYLTIFLGLAYEVLTTKQRVKTFWLIFILGIIGWTFQSFEAYLGTLVIKGSTAHAPFWLLPLWSLFMSSTLRTMPFVFKNAYVSFIFGCYALPGTYYFISKLGLAVIAKPIYNSLALDAFLSGIVFLITYFLLSHYFYKNGSLYV